MNRTIKSATILSILLLCAGMAETKAAPKSLPATGGPSATVTAQSSTSSSMERQKEERQNAAQRTLINDAVAAISETQKAMVALSKGDSGNALAALERATGKLDLLLARNPTTALLPVRAETIVIESAPVDLPSIKQTATRVERALDARDYPLARVLLAGLQDEIRVRTYNLPLATYPQAIKDAARLIDGKKLEDARTVLASALNTLVLVDHVIPEPLVKAQAAVGMAESLKTKDRKESLRLLENARRELERAEALGYAGKGDPQVSALKSSIDAVNKQFKAGDSIISFEDLKTKLANFFKFQTERGRSTSSR